MAPQWMPQNLQKRLLLYILQQLSLFSEIDLPNLDVSLGSSSQVTLTDVELDPDALQVPGIYLRDGKVSNMKLQLNMSGGVTIEGDGLNLTMALASSSNSSNFENSILTDKSKFSLAQSTIDLATSVMKSEGDEDGLNDFQTPHQSFHESQVDDNSTDNDTPSALNNVMTKAVEAALARLQVSLSNISIRLIMDQATVDVVIDKVSISTNDGLRHVDVSDVIVLAVKPECDPGEHEEESREENNDNKPQDGTNDDGSTSTLNPETAADKSEPAPADEEYEDKVSDENDSDSDDSDDSDDDDDNIGMMSSSILEKPSDLDSSLVYSKEEASSIYMSATSNLFQRAKPDENATRLMSLNNLKVSFSGLSKIKDLKVEVDQVKIAATPLPNTLLHVLESLAILNLKDTISRHSSLNSKIKQRKFNEAKEDNLEAGQFLDSITVNTIEISLISALLENGNFAKPEGLRIISKNFQLTRKDPDLTFGNLQTLSIINNTNDIVLKFDGDSSKNDLRFELKGKTNEFTLLLSKNLEINLDQYTIQKFINITSLLSQIQDSLHKFNSSKPIKKPSKSSILFQNASTIINLNLDGRSAFNLCIYPISYDSNKGSLSIDKITLTRDKVPLISLFKLEVDILAAEKQIRSFDNFGHEIVLTTPCFVSVDKIEMEHQYPALKVSLDAFFAMFKSLIFPVEEIRFKARKKTRISTNVMFQSKQSVKMRLTINEISMKLKNVHPKFGDVDGSLRNVTVLLYKDNQAQLHSMYINLERHCGDLKEVIIDPINIEDKSAPFLSLKIRESKNINGFLRNAVIEYYTKWLSIFDNNSSQKDDSVQSSVDLSMMSPASHDNDSNLEMKLNLVDCAIGLNPGRLESKANLVVRNGTLDLKLQRNIIVKSQLRSAVLLLIDDTRNILSLEEAKRFRNLNRKPSWSQVSFLNSRGYSSVANINSLHLETIIKKDGRLNDKGGFDSMINMNISADMLDIDLCADSSQCLTQLLNDLKQPVAVSNEMKYKYKGPEELNVFEDVDDVAFKSNNQDSLNTGYNPIVASQIISEPLNIVDSYYGDNETIHNEPLGNSSTASDILDKNLNELTIDQDTTLERNPFYTNDVSANTEGNNSYSTNSSENKSDKSDKSDSIILFNDGHFEESSSNNNSVIHSVKNENYPMTLNLYINQVSLKIYDGYDWKHTRKTINNAVKRLEKKAAEEKEKRQESNNRSRRPSRSFNQSREEQENNEEDEDNDVIGETLFDSIHVAFPISSDPSRVAAKINRDIQSREPTKQQLDDEEGTTTNGIEVGNKNNIKKLKLRRSKFQKIIIELHEVEVKFTMISNNDPLSSSSSSSSKLKNTNEKDYEILNDIDIKVSDFEIIDNVPTSTWNKFTTSMKTTEREVGSSMLSMNIKTIRPVLSLAATELLMDVHVLPLRLHVDQDTLELLTRFGEFKDSRFNLVDEFDDVIYIQKFQINSIHIKLDYKPKKIDYTGLRSGHTTEFMNFFILDEADMILKKVKLYGISGFPRLGQMLNGLWMPDIKSTQLSGVLAGLAPVRSIVSIGSGFKDLVVVPVNEYKKDGRIYRSFSKGFQHFTKNTTNELLKFGVKIAAGTQTLLEHTEEALGGNGASSRISQQEIIGIAGGGGKNRNNDTVIYEEEEEVDDDDDDDFNSDDDNLQKGLLASQLIGRSSLSTKPLQKSIYQPALESFADLRGGNSLNNDDDHHSHNHDHNHYNNNNNKNFKSQHIGSISKKDVLYINDNNELEAIEDSEDESQRTISLYANQPINLKEGFQLAYDSFGRHLLVAKSAIVNAGTEIGDSGSAQDSTIAIVKATPIALIRPMIGATEAISKTLLGVTNQLDPEQRKYIDDKYKTFKKKK